LLALLSIGIKAEFIGFVDKHPLMIAGKDAPGMAKQNLTYTSHALCSAALRNQARGSSVIHDLLQCGLYVISQR
jgi:hypothetical protein